jgi:hypothetical protein
MHLLSWIVTDGNEGNLSLRLEQNIVVSKYAILSHRWGNPEDEVSFEDMLSGKQEERKGYQKLMGCCKQAQKDGLQHVWVDTCCINKASSAELSEAITSMFAFYERSTACYVLLADVLVTSSAYETIQSEAFSQSDWFTRGWTLQELIAPRNVKFFDGAWSFLGYKTSDSLSRTIATITGVDSLVLNDPSIIKAYSISKKMSWAARRRTTRTEDRAYSLMGIFGVFMTPMYGEGTHAFVRLQKAVMSTSNDHSIFAWTTPPVAPLTEGFERVSTLLALSPDQFEYSSEFRPLSRTKGKQTSSAELVKFDYTMTNAGLSIRLPVWKVAEVEGLYGAFLSCTESWDQTPSAIFLRTTDNTPAGHFWRTNCNEGPIERVARAWFPSEGRDAVAESNVYILPRFTSLSGDIIEPPWNEIDMLKATLENATVHLRAEQRTFTIRTEILKHLRHAPDFSAKELASLRDKQQGLAAKQGAPPHKKLTVDQHRPASLLPLRPRNFNFYGRAREMQGLMDILLASEGDSERHDGGMTTCTITGIGGVGKTEVATEFAYRCLGDFFDVVLWIGHGSDADAVARRFELIALDLKLVEKGSSRNTVIREIMGWLASFSPTSTFSVNSGSRPARWLLVFDDVSDPEALKPYWPLTGPGCVIVISRDPAIWINLRCPNITVDVFSAQDGSALLQRLTKFDSDFTELSTRVNGLPIGITQLAGVIIRTQQTPEAIVRQFDKENKPRGIVTEENHTLSSLWSSTLESLTPMSLALLQVLSFLDPDFIPDPLLGPLRSSALTHSPRTEEDVLASRTELINAALVKRTAKWDGISIHRLIQSVVKERMTPEDFLNAFLDAVALVSSYWTLVSSYNSRSLSTQELRQTLLQHVRRLHDIATESKGSENEPAFARSVHELSSLVRK